MSKQNVGLIHKVKVKFEFYRELKDKVKKFSRVQILFN